MAYSADMKKSSPLYVCTKCDAQLEKWSGQCLECGSWGTVKAAKEVEVSSAPSVALAQARPGKIQAFNQLGTIDQKATFSTGLGFLDRFFSGGLVHGSVTLVGGEPGIGKSTLLAQLALVLAQKEAVLYVTGEESPQQVFLRLKRIRKDIPSSLQFLDITQADTVAATLAEQKPKLAIIDSIQSLRSPSVPGEPGNPTQIRASAAVITEAAKKSGVSVIFVGQVTKDGDLAGPRLLEHLVDTVAMLEGDRSQLYRVLRLLKHRFGTTEESVILSMDESGLQEVVDPSAAFIAHRPMQTSGSVITCLLEGTRPLLVEIQALVSPAGFSTPARRVSGVDQNRVNLILAVLAKRCGIGFGDQDVFVNAVGGVDATDPSCDLAIALALASSKSDKIIPNMIAAWGEIGLGGELRPVPRSTLLEKEAKRLGFSQIIQPSDSLKLLRDAVNELRLK